MDEKIKSKIQKLLALSSSPVESEAQSAMLKARELMIKYKLSELDIKDADLKKLEIVTIKTDVTFTKYTDKWIMDLADVIASNNCCEAFMTHLKRAKRRSVTFMGIKDDAEFVEQTFYYARYSIYQEINKIRRKYYEYGYTITDLRPRTDSYAKGFIAGLSDQYKEQAEKNQEWGLVLATPQEVKDYSDSLEIINLGPDRVIEAMTLQIGYADGHSFTMKDKLTNSDFDARDGVDCE